MKFKKKILWYFDHGKNDPKVVFLRRNIENYIYNFLHVYSIGKKTFDAQLSVIFLLSRSNHDLNIDISIFTQHKRAKYRYQNILVSL